VTLLAGGQTGTGANPDYVLLTPDALLVFSQPPVSCDSVAFTFTNPITREVLPGASTDVGGYKTLAQMDVYDCDPFQPGLFFRKTGGTPAANEYQEGQAVTVEFNGAATNGAFGIVTVAATPTDPNTTTP
jgi:hypothetical protein